MTGAISGEEELYLHRPVMAQEVVRYLNVNPGSTVVDATLGGGGHAREIAQAISPGGELIGMDRDPDAVAAAARALDIRGVNVRIIKGRMGEIADVMQRSGINFVDAILADLGVSSFQLDSQSRGFSFRSDGPLDMRMDPTAGESAAELLMRLDEEEIADILKIYGEERHARKIAREIARRRGMQRTSELAEAVMRMTPPAARHGRIHPATRTFQALRIAVNDELGELKCFLVEAPQILRPGGRLVIVSYHSLEDRLVKFAFRDRAAEGEFSLPIKKPLVPCEKEIGENPRARSAKLRVLERARV